MAPMSPESHLLHGCWLEAERADRVALGLDELRTVLDRSFHGHMIALMEEIRVSSRMLRELAGHSGSHRSRTLVVAYHLNLLLPCMSKTLRDITNYYSDNTISRDIRWRKMYHEMMKEAGGISLTQRFFLYNHFLRLLLYLLTRDKHFDPGQLEMLRHKILDLRQRRGIPVPVQAPATAVGPSLNHQVVNHHPGANSKTQPPPHHAVTHLHHDTAIVPLPREQGHWCEAIFAIPLSSRTDMAGPEKSCVALPLAPPWHPDRPVTRKTLMRRSFDSQKMCVKFCLDTKQTPFVEIRVYTDGMPRHVWKGHHELLLRRDGNTLVLCRWSCSILDWKVWAMLSFITWEELVLFYCTFTALKACNPLMPTIRPSEYQLDGEKELFMAHIIDDGSDHCLVAYRDGRSDGMRLHTAVREGVLRQCPVWTAFVTYISASPNWLVRKTKRIFHVLDIQLYVFCQKYREAHMRRNRLKAFEIHFARVDGEFNLAVLYIYC
ncbi:hypothetical protein BD289DRAFT_463552 [Coniella lustricola]|uniref:Uncharacterized protein n=1 Tax=Coniella lustricola TaxID=2025994 RepID=A0A2T2ZV66_9PEZI|nr:hypothetical protein BD289DRAFT_463552 [Coniella lustricola]